MFVNTINKKPYLSKINDFEKYQHKEYNYLQIYPIVGLLERHLGLLKDIASDVFQNKCNLSVIGNTHGGFLPLNATDHFKNVHVDYFEISPQNTLVYVSPSFTLPNNLLEYVNSKCFILSPENSSLTYEYKYKLSSIEFENSSEEYYLYVPEEFHISFLEHFYYYLKNDECSILEYDNLINFCVMVKNGGELFEQMLTENLPIIDRWTILDTGSTDNTIEIINKVLRHKKGKLYQEPFINFRDSRNRCLDLAETNCKFNVMLDDTYAVRGNLREFLETVRGDQFADSFSLLILSDDTEYYSNRITKSENKLRYIYKIHEVINNKNNVNVVIPKHVANVYDHRADYMEKRTMDRKKYDLDLLFEEVKDNPDDPRNYYYIAQTYNLMNDYEKSAEWFLKRAYHPVEGFFQEKVESLFEAARTYNFKLNKPWEEVEKMYLQCYEWEPERPEALYFLGIHYYLEKDFKKAYSYFLKAFEIGYPISKQFSLKPTLSFHFLPKFLSQLCYENKNYKVGEECCLLFLKNNKPTDDSYEVVRSWYQIFVNLNKLPALKNLPIIGEQKVLCFLVDGGFSNWSGRDILTKGVGGSETWAIETARYIKKTSDFRVVFFCKCDKEDIFEGVEYYPIDKFFEFASINKIEHCIVSRFSEYIPAIINSHVENIYLMLHDLGPSGIVIPVHRKLKKVFCLTEWHKQYFLSSFPQFKDRTDSYHYGIDHNKFGEVDITKKVPYSFIYSSFPNRGLLILLKMWPTIKRHIPQATLNIYSDVFGSWVNNNYPEEMKEIQSMLWDETGVEKYYKQGIIYHGWVSKEELAKGWKQADIWFYPCKFAETFCLTALEAAATKTLAITNNLAALQNTVGDRGVSIEGDVTTIEWQEKAIKEIISILNEPIKKLALIDKNFEWSKEHTWERRAINFCNTYLVDDKEKEVEGPIEIKNVGEFYMYKDDYITTRVKLEGDWEPEINHIFDRYLTKDSIAIDVGAFVGTHTVKMARKCKQLYSFEPFPSTFDLLKKNIELNNLTNVKIFHNAVGNDNRVINTMYFPEILPYMNNISNYGAMRINYDFEQNTSMDVNVRMCRLDDMFETDHIDFIKIDSEGFEIDVIKGAKNIITRCKPILLIENHNILDSILNELEYIEYNYEKIGVENVILFPKK